MERTSVVVRRVFSPWRGGGRVDRSKRHVKKDSVIKSALRGISRWNHGAPSENEKNYFSRILTG